MTVAAQAMPCPWDTTVTGAVALGIKDERVLITDRIQDSYALGFGGKGVIDELNAVCAECSHPNWDGYGGLPVSPQTYVNTRNYLKSLPLGSPAPSVGAEPDGHLTLEWYNGRRRTLSVSISPDGNLHYAAILGPSTSYGTEPLGTHAKVIEDLIHQVMTT